MLNCCRSLPLKVHEIAYLQPCGCTVCVSKYLHDTQELYKKLGPTTLYYCCTIPLQSIVVYRTQYLPCISEMCMHRTAKHESNIGSSWHGPMKGKVKGGQWADTKLSYDTRTRTRINSSFQRDNHDPLANNAPTALLSVSTTTVYAIYCGCRN